MVSERMSWWRRARWPLVALLVLVPAAVAASASVDAVDYLASRPSVVTTVPAGETGELGPARIRLVDSWVATADSTRGARFEVPEGAAIVSATLELDAGAASEDFGCRVTLLEPRAPRHWRSSLSAAGYYPGEDLPEDLPEDTPSGCSWAQTPFPFEVAFLVPEDAVDDIVLEVVTSDQLPRALHLRLD